MKATYDKEADAAYLQFKPGKSAETKEVDSDILMDYDKKGNVLGIEVLNAKKRVPAKILKTFLRIDTD